MSPRINVDLQDVPAGSVILPETLLYLGEVTDAELRSTEKGQYINLELEVKRSTGPDVEEWAGEILYDVLPLPGVALSTDDRRTAKRKLRRGMRLKEFLARAGARWEPTGFETEDLIGLNAWFNVTTDEYQGRKRSRPNRYFTNQAEAAEALAE